MKWLTSLWRKCCWQYGGGQQVCFRSIDQEWDDIMIEGDLLWTWGPFCRVRIQRYAYPDMTTEHFLLIEQPVNVTKFWWNLGYFKLEER